MSKHFYFSAIAAVCIILNFVNHKLWAQEAIPIGSWRTHFSYHDVRHVLPVKDRIYCASRYGLFYLDKSDHSLTTLSTPGGLSDVGITAMAYQSDLDVVLLAYQSGAIDMLAGNRIVPFSLIQDAGVNEQIHHIAFDDNTVYLSTSKGVRVLTIADHGLSIRESYTGLGQSGDDLAVYSSVITRDSIFLATATGIIGNALGAQVNRQDFRTWKRFALQLNAQNLPVRHLTLHNGLVYAGIDYDGIYVYDNQHWQKMSALTVAGTDVPGMDIPGTDVQGSFSALQSNGSSLIAVAGDTVILTDSNGNSHFINGDLIEAPQDAAIDEQGKIWIGDNHHGLIGDIDGALTNYIPNGPASDNITGVRYLNNAVIALKDVSAAGASAFYTFRQGVWQAYQHLPTTAPLLDAAYDAVSGIYYFAAYEGGIMRWDGENAFSMLNAETEGSTLKNNMLTSLAIDYSRHLWATQFNSLLPVHAYSLATQSWQSFSVNEPKGHFPVKVILAEDGNPWIVTNSSGMLGKTGDDILVVDRQNGGYLFVKNHISNGALPGRQITDLVRDKDGLLWIGGDEGVAFFSNPWDVFSGVAVIRPVFQTQYLLLGEYITAIAVDEGNNKWIGTRNGLWLFGETGESLVYHFTTENSPLISNNIIDITVNHTDGEVFIATDKGIISYRGTATQEAATHQVVKIFPNPVLPDFSGTVGIQGLVGGASVKITNIAGTLVRTLETEGGSAAWDVRDYRGQRVGTGVYLVFSANSSGEETFVGKIAVID